jgi:hypothetical protein
MEQKMKLLEMDMTSLECRLNTIQLEKIQGKYSIWSKHSSPDLSGGSDNNDDSDGESAQSLFSKWFKRNKKKTKRSTFPSQMKFNRLVRRSTFKSSEEPSHSPQIATFSSQPDDILLPQVSFIGRPSSGSFILPSPTHSRDSGSCSLAGSF